MERSANLPSTAGATVDAPGEHLPITLNSRLHGGLYLLLQQLRSRPVGRYMRRIRRLEALPADAYAHRLERRLEETLERARRRVPLYGTGRWLRVPAHAAHDIGRWPVLEREDLAGNFDALHTRRPGALDVKRRSSSSTGSPVRVSMHPHAAAWQWAWEYHVMERHGVPLGTPTLVFWGGEMKPLEDWIRNRTAFSTTDLSPERLERVADVALSGRFQVLLTYPSAAFQLARHLAARKAGLRPPLGWVKVGGEPLFPFQREAIERWLGERVVNFYGASEVGPIAAECPRGALHVCLENVHLEIFDGDAPAPRGVRGDVVLTPLTNPLMPLVRYRIGDRARLAEATCGCGWARPVLEDVQAHVGEATRTEAGTEWHSGVVADRLQKVLERAPASAFRQISFERRGEGAWNVRVERADGEHPGLEQALRDVVRERVLPSGGGEREPDLVVEWTSLIPRERSGKFRYFHSSPSHR